MTKKFLLLEIFCVFLIVFGLLSIKGLATGKTVTVGLGLNADYISMQEAIAQSHDGDIIEIVSNIEELSKITIDKEVTIIAKGNVKLIANKGFNLTKNARLTLGDGNIENNLEIIGYIDNYGSLIVKDGFSISKVIKNYDGSAYQGEGGNFNGGVIIAEKATVAGKITGGNYIAKDGDVLDIYGSYDEIAGGNFVANGTTDRSAVYVQGKLHKISGGEFSSTIASGLNVQHGGVVDEIAGGNFKGVKRAITVYAGEENIARIGLITGGSFESDYALFLMAHGSAKVSVGEISGGTFIGKKSAIQLERNTILDRISGGKFISAGNGVLNVGRINNIDGGNFEAKNYAIFNYANGLIENINNGVFKGERSAVFNRLDGIILRIKNGVYYGVNGYAYDNRSTTETYIEPDLTLEVGQGRYNGKIDAITGKVIYPDGFHMSSVNTVLPVDAIPETEFRYLKKSFALSYDANGGSGNKPSDQVESSDDDVLIVASNPFTYPGREFIGWNSQADGSGITYQPNDTISLSATDSGQNKPLGNVTLYAQWEKIYRVIYDTDGANEPTPVDLEKYKLGNTITLTDVSLTKEGYQFKGWRLKNNQYRVSETIVLDNNIAKLADDMNIIFVAVFEKDPIDNSNGNKTEPNNTNNNSSENQPSIENNSGDSQITIDLDIYNSTNQIVDIHKELPNTGYTMNLISFGLSVVVSGIILIAISLYKKSK